MREPYQRHIHAEIADSINDAMIGIKLHHIERKDDSEEIRNKTHAPTWAEILTLLEQTHRELMQCREPFRKY